MDTQGTHLYQLWRKKRVLQFQLFFVIVIVVILGLWVLPRISPGNEKTDASSSSNPSGVLPKGAPNYRTLVPSGKTIDALGGWTRISPPEHNAVYAFTDTLWGIPLTVSEQPLPDSFKNDTEKQLNDLAKSYSANRSIVVDGTTVYIGTSAKGPQSLIFSKSGLLILIKSTSSLNDEQWTNYVRSLN